MVLGVVSAGQERKTTDVSWQGLSPSDLGFLAH